MSVIGKRKLIVILAYLFTCPALVWLTGSTEGIAAIMVALSSGVAAFVWANVKENGTHR